MIKIISIVGARPNFMKIAPLHKALKKHHKQISHLICHTGQHFDNNMSNIFIDQLELPRPDYYLGVGSGTHAEQTGKIMIKFEKLCIQEKPNLIIVVGDVNSTLACALVGAKLCIPTAHIEAGLRSFDRTMPEEINRILTDKISDYLFTTCEDANKNLIREGIPKSKIFFVGNTMIETLHNYIGKIKKSDIIEKFKLKKDNNIMKYGVLTLHRPSNVDNPAILEGILNAINYISRKVPIIFPAHPRTIKQIKKFKFNRIIDCEGNKSINSLAISNQRILTIPPLGYLDFLNFMSHATFILTDSGGIQEESTILGIPCLTIRNNTERPITIKEGTNILVGNNPDKIIKTAMWVLKNGKQRKSIPKYWDENVSERIMKVLINKLK